MDVTGKSLLIFGAGLNQMELIREARNLGLTTIVIDPQEDPPGRHEADFFYCVDGNDYDTTRAIAIKHKVSGVVTGQMEKPLRLMAKLAKELGFMFNSPEVTEQCLDKWLMKETFLANNILCARGILIKTGEDIHVRLSGGMTFPLIIKPCDAFSSRGVYKCDSLDEVIAHLEESRYYSINGDVLLEEYIEGTEYSIEAITSQGKTTIIQFTEKFITPYPNTVETGHLQPADLTSAEKKDISNVVESALTALGIVNSASHTEVMMTGTGPKVIETGARLGGDFIASYLTKASTGVSMDRAAIQVALGMEPDLTSTRDKHSMIKYIELPEGKTVKEVLPFDDVRELPGVIFTNVFLKEGDITEHLTHSALRPACVLAEADNREELLNRIEEYANILTKRIILT